MVTTIYFHNTTIQLHRHKKYQSAQEGVGWRDYCAKVEAPKKDMTESTDRLYFGSDLRSRPARGR
jgi:hypothetical protein